MAPRNSVTNLRGEQGTFTISDAQPHEGNWANFVVIVDAVLAAATLPKESGDAAALIGVIYPQGFVFDGPISSITLTSGVVRMYNYIDPTIAENRNQMQG